MTSPFSFRVAAALAAFGALLLTPVPSRVVAQTPDTQRIAAVVNEDVISLYDVLNRLQLTIATSGLEDNSETRARLQPQILRALIDERLQTQEANRLNASVTDREITDAFGRIEDANRMARGALTTRLGSMGVNVDSFRNQIRANVAWQKVIQRKLRPQLQVGEDEIDEVIDRINANKGTTEYLLAEMFLAVETPDQEAETLDRLRELVEQMQRGAGFAAIAEQFSQAASASEGGDIGWVERGQLDDETVGQLDQMASGRLTNPIRTPTGFYLYYLRDKRLLAAASPDDATITLAQLLLPIEPSASQGDIVAQRELADTVHDSVAGCDDFQRVATELNVGQVDPTPDLRIGDLAAAVRPVVSALKVGEPSAPQVTSDGVLILMVCARQEPKSNLPSRDDISDNLTRQRLDLVARRYLRDLRAQAFIDIRA